MTQKILSLCSGIGGFEMAMELANQQLGFVAFETVALCEIEPFPQKILRSRFPNILLFNDVKTITIESLRQRGISRIDGICGGIPCTPFSHCGKQGTFQDERNLFPEFFRLVREVRPRWSIIENVPALLSVESGRFFRNLLWEFSDFGATVRWDLLSCAEIGGSHRRERLFIVATYPQIL